MKQVIQKMENEALSGINQTKIMIQKLKSQQY